MATRQQFKRVLLHSFKIGLVVSLVLLLCVYKPGLYDILGPAIITMVGIFQISVGETVFKFLNLLLASLAAAMSAIISVYVGEICGEKAKHVLIALFIFTLCVGFSLSGLVSVVKKWFDIGVMTITLIFTFVTVSGYNMDKIWSLGVEKLCIMLLAVLFCVLVSLCGSLVWSGQELHDVTVRNLERLAEDLSQCVGSDGITTIDDPVKFLQGYLDSKASEDNLAKFAILEPPHGGFRFNHPWKSYLKTCDLARACDWKMKTSCGLTNLEEETQQACTKAITEMTHALKELALGVKTMTSPSTVVESHIHNARTAIDELKMVHKPTTSNLIDNLTENLKGIEIISASVHELSRKARFSEPESTVSPVNQHHVVIDIDRLLASTKDDTDTPEDDYEVIEIGSGYGDSVSSGEDDADHHVVVKIS